jgi:hypothetical protein
LPQLLGEVLRLEVRRLLRGATEFRLHPNPEWEPDAAVDDSCQLEFFLNGSLVRQRIDDIREIVLHTVLLPQFVTAIEVYEGAMAPVGTPESCGAVILWVARIRHKDDPAFSGTLRGRVVGLNADVPPGSVRLRLEPGGAEGGARRGGLIRLRPSPPRALHD